MISGSKHSMSTPPHDWRTTVQRRTKEGMNHVGTVSLSRTVVVPVVVVVSPSAKDQRPRVVTRQRIKGDRLAMAIT